MATQIKKKKMKFSFSDTTFSASSYLRDNIERYKVKSIIAQVDGKKRN